MGDKGAKEKNVDQLQYQMMVSSQIMPYDEEQVRPWLLLAFDGSPQDQKPEEIECGDIIVAIVLFVPCSAEKYSAGQEA